MPRTRAGSVWRCATVPSGRRSSLEECKQPDRGRVAAGRPASQEIGRGQNRGEALSGGLMADSCVVEVRNLTKRFSGFLAWNPVSLKIRQGTIHALIGPNGAGKTTLFNLITRFLTPTSGQIFYKGRDITREKASTLARIGLCRSFQI